MMSKLDMHIRSPLLPGCAQRELGDPGRVWLMPEEEKRQASFDSEAPKLTARVRNPVRRVANCDHLLTTTRCLSAAAKNRAFDPIRT